MRGVERRFATILDEKTGTSMDPRRQPSRIPAAMVLPGVLSILAVIGFLGCQGCQSEAGGTKNPGGADEVTASGETESDPAPSGNGKASPSPAPARETSRARAIGEKIDFIENGILQLSRQIDLDASQGKAVMEEKVYQTFRDAVDAHPGDGRYMVMYGFALYHQKKLPQARDWFDRALEKDADLLPAWKGIALTWAAEKNEAKVKEALAQLEHPSVPLLYGLLEYADFLVQIEDLDKAEMILRQAKTKFSGSYRPFLALAELRGRQEAWEAGLEEVENALERAPESQRAWLVKYMLHRLYARDIASGGKAAPKAGAIYEQQVKLAEDALKACVAVEEGSQLGTWASEELERIQDPFKPYKELALNSEAPLRKRQAALAVLLRVAKEVGIGFWKKVLDLPVAALRVYGAQGALLHGGKEGLDPLLGILTDASKQYIERANAVQWLKKFKREWPDVSEEHGEEAVEAILKGLELCRERFSGGDTDESAVFEDMIDLLARWTGVRIAEWRDNSTKSGMDETLKEWREWWAKQHPSDEDGKEG